MKKAVGVFAGWRRFATSQVGEFARHIAWVASRACAHVGEFVRHIAWVASRAGAQVHEFADSTPAFVGSLDHCAKKLKADR
jgi:hypothetical protein